jgi:hypothetical protein
MMVSCQASSATNGPLTRPLCVLSMPGVSVEVRVSRTVCICNTSKGMTFGTRKE